MEATQTLKEKYEAAKTNVASAPGEYEIAKKKYFTYIMGQSGYDEYIKNNLTAQSNNIETNINAAINPLLLDMKDLNDTYKTSYSSY